MTTVECLVNHTVNYNKTTYKLKKGLITELPDDVAKVFASQQLVKKSRHTRKSKQIEVEQHKIEEVKNLFAIERKEDDR